MGVGVQERVIPPFEIRSQESLRSFGPNIESLREEVVVMVKNTNKEREQVVGGVTVREMWLEEGELYYRDGNEELVSYEQIFRESEKEYADNQLLAERFGVEGVAWHVVAEMLREIDESQVVVMLSPPGEAYRISGQPPLSATFLLRKMRNGQLLAYATYVPEISEGVHVDIFGLSLEMDTNEIVKSPVVMSAVGVNESLKKLGFVGWGEVCHRAVNLDNETEYQDRNVYQAILELRRKFDKRGEVEFWDSFNMMVKDLVLKDVKGELADKSLGEIVKDGMIYLSESSDGSIKHSLGWLLVGEGVTANEVDEWRVNQMILQQQRDYMMGWGSHGNGVEMPDFGQKGKHMDLRVNQLVYESRKKNKEIVKCGCGEKIAREKIPCKCPNCKKEVSKEGA